MTLALAALHEWMEKHPFLTHFFGPLVGALITLVIVPAPWLLMADGLPAFAIPPLPDINLYRLAVVSIIGGVFTLIGQVLLINEDTSAPACSLLSLSNRGWARFLGSVSAFIFWTFLGTQAAASFPIVLGQSAITQ